MASSGSTYIQQLTVSAPPELVMQNLVAASAGARDYSLIQAGPQTLILTRRYIPTWAIVVAVIGFLLFLVGLLALLFKETETLTVIITTNGPASHIQINGQATPDMIARLEAVLRTAPALP